MNLLKKLAISTLIGLSLFGAVPVVSASILFTFQGGTGTGVQPASGSILIGAGDGSYAPNFLTAGSNITITNASGSVTIASTGGSATSTIVASGGTATGPAFTFVTSTASGVWNVTSSGGTVRFVLPSNVSFFTNDAGYLTSIGAVPATTTINQMQLSVFNFLASGPGLTVASSAVGNITYTYSSSSLNLGTAANQNIATFLQSANNLSDLGNVSSSLVNLRLASGSTVTFLNLFANAFDINGNKYVTSTTGALLVVNNLNDLNNVSSALVNLRLSSSSLVTFGTLVVQTSSFANVSGTNISVTGYGTFPSLFFTSASGTNETLSGYLQVSGTLTDSNNNKYSTSTVSTSTFSFGVSFSSSSAAQSPPLRMPYSGTIFSWTMSAGASCSGVYDVWKAAGAIPTKANTIVGSDFPTLASQTINSSTALTGWTKTFAAGDYFIVSATSTATTCNAGSVQMNYQKN